MEVLHFGLILSFFLYNLFFDWSYMWIYIGLIVLFVFLEYYSKPGSINCYKSWIFMSNWNSTGSPHVLFSDEVDLQPVLDLIESHNKQN